jgi:hypothetical protein
MTTIMISIKVKPELRFRIVLMLSTGCGTNDRNALISKDNANFRLYTSDFRTPRNSFIAGESTLFFL